MNRRYLVTAFSLAAVCLPLGATTFACSEEDPALAEQASSVRAAAGDATAPVDDGVIDLGCPAAPTTCEVDGPLQAVDSEVDRAGSIRVMGGTEDKDFYDKCKAALTGATAATAHAVKVCIYTVAVCGALVGNGNGTDIQKFCKAASSVLNCKGAAKEDGRKLQEAVCESKCSKTVACAKEAGVEEASTGAAK